jgi:hypothetical protein
MPVRLPAMKNSVRRWFCISALLVCTAAMWLRSIRQAQYSPHVITQSINGRVVRQFTVTNPGFISMSDWHLEMTEDGPRFRAVVHTNYYWHQWGWLK